jgi:hypothetical protein
MQQWEAITVLRTGQAKGRDDVFRAWRKKLEL